MTSPLIGVVMGSSSDWDTMQHAVQILTQFGVPHTAQVVSAHRMPDDMFAYAEGAQGRGLRAIIAGAGGAAHLPGMLAAKTVVPVLGVPVASRHLQGVDSLHSIVQMPKGVPVATFAIGAAGAANAALFAVAMLASGDAAGAKAKIEELLKDWPSDPYSYFVLAEAERKLGNAEAAAEATRRANVEWIGGERSLAAA